MLQFYIEKRSKDESKIKINFKNENDDMKKKDIKLTRTRFSTYKNRSVEKLRYTKIQ